MVLSSASPWPVHPAVPTSFVLHGAVTRLWRATEHSESDGAESSCCLLAMVVTAARAGGPSLSATSQPAQVLDSAFPMSPCLGSFQSWGPCPDLFYICKYSLGTKGRQGTLLLFGGSVAPWYHEQGGLPPALMDRSHMCRGQALWHPIRLCRKKDPGNPAARTLRPALLRFPGAKGFYFVFGKWSFWKMLGPF